jgi:predicted HD phosphohydrolase
MTPAPFTTVTDLEAFLRRIAETPSDEPGLGELEHGLQCAAVLRGWASADVELHVAGLVHDIGAALGHTRDHGAVGADAVRPVLGQRVADLVRLHVDAKRFLVTRDPAYRAGLSPVSLASLEAQGGGMSAAEFATFEANPHHHDAIRLREADDLAKVPGKPTPGLETWLPALRHLAEEAAHGLR